MIVVGGFADPRLMHAPAAGLLAAELILDGEITPLPPADVSLARFSRSIQELERTGFSLARPTVTGLRKCAVMSLEP